MAGGFVGAYLIDHLSLERDLVKVTATVEGLEKMVDFQTQQSEVQLETTLNQNNIDSRIAGLQRQIDELRATTKAPSKHP